MRNISKAILISVVSTSGFLVHATTGTVEGAEKGAALLSKLEEMHRSGESGFKPGAFLH
jgi:hypothetical protein